MAELNLKQIVNKLNEEFKGDTRKLVFWYDDKGDFSEDINSIELENAKIYLLEKDNQFYTKYFFEKVDTTTNYLVYAPFPKPDVEDNHLEDIVLYSKRFFADRASLLSVDLGIDEKYKPIIEKHIKFFANKERTQRFYDLEIENFNEENILIGLFSAICKTRTCSFEEVIRVIITEDSINDNNKFITEIEKYDLLNSFWKLCEQYFGYTDINPSLERLVVTMFVTYTDRYIHKELPKAWKTFVSFKSGNIIAFLDNLMNNVIYRQKYDELSKYVSDGLNAVSMLSNYSPEDLIDCDTFIVIDNIIVKWIIERLTNEDIGAKLDNLSIPQICEKRSKMHFGDKTNKIYSMLNSAYYIISYANYKCPNNLDEIINNYRNNDYLIDYEYRRFYYFYDTIENTQSFETLRTLVENIYTNEYLEKQIYNWNLGISEKQYNNILPLQRNFYDKYVKNINVRTVVIISDAMRYEVGMDLFNRMSDNPNCTAKIDVMLGVLPSYTKLGMASLLPHNTITMTDDFKVIVDDINCDNIVNRQKVIQNHCENSICLQFDDIKSLNTNELRDIFTGKQVIYVYHNQIDARGDKANTENEVFVACEEAVLEIMSFINKVSKSANTNRFIVTSDHGFIYKRDKLEESDKIENIIDDTKSFVNRRFIISEKSLKYNGVSSVDMGYVLGNDDNKNIYFPVTDNVFKVSGGGQNYVHGGSSPQEMLIPVIDIKMERGHIETKPAEIALVSMVQKITNLITTMDFIQSEPVSDIVKSATYRIFFVSDDNEKISNDNIYIADNRDTNPQNRIFRLKFDFKNKKYDRNKKYYMVVVREDNINVEVWRHDIIMDIAFADDYGFGF